MGGGRYSNCSIIEALDLVEDIANISIKRSILKKYFDVTLHYIVFMQNGRIIYSVWQQE